MPTWDEFAWAAFLYGGIGGDSDYQAIRNPPDFLDGLRSNPTDTPIDEIRERLIKGFLNHWHCHVTNNEHSADEIRARLMELRAHLQALTDFSVETVNFGQLINVNGTPMSVEQCIEHCYARMAFPQYNLATVAASKVLHILRPSLFVMWDGPILSHYRNIDRAVSNTPAGYSAYLHHMKDMATQLTNSFHEAALNPPADANDTVAAYLSRHMLYNPPKTMAKYLDEFNWVRFTRHTTVPRPWHP